MDNNEAKTFDLYDSQEKYADSSKERTIKPIIAGLLLLIPGGISFIVNLLGLIDILNGSGYWTPEPFIISLRLVTLSAMFISMIGGYYAIRRTHYKFALYSSLICFIGFNLLGLISLVLILLSEYEFNGQDTAQARSEDTPKPL